MKPVNSIVFSETACSRRQESLSVFPCCISGIGSYLPSTKLTNHELEQRVDTSDEWITERTGIKERRIAGENEFTSTMAFQAASRALMQSGVSPSELDFIIVATVTPDMPFPSTACLVQEMLGARRAAAVDIQAACTGFLYAMEIGRQFIATGTYSSVLVIGAEKLSSIVNWSDRNTCVLFGDGAGAVVLRRGSVAKRWRIYLGADGSKGDLLRVPAGGCRMPPSIDTVRLGLHYIHMDGRETFRHAVQAMVAAATKVLEEEGLQIHEVRCVIPHQANRRIIEAVAERLGAKPEQVFVNLDRYGNTSAASVAIALDEAAKSGRVREGDLILLVAFGAGFTWGAALIEL